MSRRSLTVVDGGYSGVPAALDALDKLHAQIKNAANFEALDKIAMDAKALQVRFGQFKGVSDRAGVVWTDAEVTLGQRLSEIPKAVGTRGQIKSAGPGRGNKTGGTALEPPVSDAPTLKELQISKRRSTRSRKLASIPEPKRAEYVEALIEDDKAVSPDAVLRKQREENKRAKVYALMTAAFSEDGPFGCVVIDPPWAMEKIDRDLYPNQDAFDYPTMSTEEITAFWRDEMAPKLEPDCHLFMWTTQRFLPASLKIIEDIGFRYVLVMVWHKAGGFQPIGLPQYNCEFAVYARRGSPVFIDTKDFMCCFNAPRREHSRKPDEFYDTIRRVTGGSRIDVFSRERREGFAQFGNEISKFAEVA